MIVEVACVCLEAKDLPREQKPFLHDAPCDKRQAALRFTLTRGIRILSRMSKHNFHLLQDIEDPSLVYYIGRWRSLASYTEFRASAEREELISALRYCEASLAWHEISNAEYSRSRNVALKLLQGPKDIFEAPLVGIARCQARDGLETGGGEDLEWVLSCTCKHPTHKSLIGRKPLVEFCKDVLLSNEMYHGSSDDGRACLVIGEWNTVDHKGGWRGDGCSQVRCSDLDLRIGSPLHLH
jgi:hypothetical protein